MDENLISIDAAKEAVAAYFEEAGVRHADAVSVANALVMAEAEGQAGHGISRVSSYLAQFESGKINRAAEIRVSREGPSILRIDADGGFAYPALDRALEEACAIARENGVCMALISRSHHCGALGYQVERYARSGLIALMMANTPAAMAPFGGRHKKLGTNPIAFAAPVAGRPPLVIDLALSVVARGKIVLAQKSGEVIPEGWAIDNEGNATTDPGHALQGSLLPLGGAKGYALALMVEVMAAALTGANSSAEASSFFDASGDAPHTGQFILVIDPSKSGSDFTERLDSLLLDIASDDAVRIPGQRRADAIAKATKSGILKSSLEILE